MVAIADWDAAGRPDHVVHDPGAVPLPARPRARRSGSPAIASGSLQPPGRRQLRPRPRSLPDRRHRRAAGPARAAAGEDRVRAAGGVRGVPDPRAVHDPAAHRGRRAEGRLLARDCHVVIDNGAYVSWGSTTPYVMMSTVAGLYRCPTCASTPRSPTRTIRTRARCAATATSSRRSRSRARWTSSPSGSASIGSRSAGAT